MHQNWMPKKAEVNLRARHESYEGRGTAASFGRRRVGVRWITREPANERGPMSGVRVVRRLGSRRGARLAPAASLLLGPVARPARHVSAREALGDGLPKNQHTAERVQSWLPSPVWLCSSLTLPPRPRVPPRICGYAFASSRRRRSVGGDGVFQRCLCPQLTSPKTTSTSVSRRARRNARGTAWDALHCDRFTATMAAASCAARATRLSALAAGPCGDGVRLHQGTSFSNVHARPGLRSQLHLQRSQPPRPRVRLVWTVLGRPRSVPGGRHLR